MLTATLRRSGGSLIVTLPQSYIEQNHLTAGSQLAVEISGAELRIKPTPRHRSLEDLLTSTPEGLHRVDGWDELSVVGNEQ